MSSAIALQNKKQRGLQFSPICFLLLVMIVTLLPLTPPFHIPELEDFSGWKTSNLLWLDPGDASAPENSLIAVYFRQQPLQSQVRLDLLALNHYDASDFSIALDIYPGGSKRLPGGDQTELDWDVLISIPAGQMPTAIRPNGNPVEAFRPRVQMDLAMEMIVISWNRGSLGVSGNNMRFQVFVYPAGSQTVSSFTPALRTSQPAPSTAPLLLAFWNALPAATSAQALRRWDGAHTGPVGQRHGLNTLLTRASEFDIPLALLDLRQAPSLSALEYMQHASQVRQSIASQQVIAPNTANGDPGLMETILQVSQTQLGDLGWQSSLFNFAPIPLAAVQSGQSYFADLTDRQRIIEWRGTRLIPLPISPYQASQSEPRDEITPSGLTLTLKQELLTAARSADPTDLVVIGGALNQSLWAEDSIAPLAFRYIAAHPWITPLNATHLAAFPARLSNDAPISCEDLLCAPPPPKIVLHTSLGTPVPSSTTPEQLMETFRNQISSLPDNAYAQSAMQTYLALTSASADPSLAQLKSSYLNQVGGLIFTAQWAESPTRFSTLDLDVDWDGMPEVVLASENFILIAEPDDGRIVLAGSTTSQWIAPSSQFAVGLGTPSEWRLGFGEASDPQVIRGALADADIPGKAYQVLLKPDSIILSHATGLTKTYRLTDNGFDLTVESIQPIQTSIPLVLALDSTHPSFWAAQMQPVCQNQTCLVPTSTSDLLIASNASSISLKSCLDSALYMTMPEIPDRSYPSGHFLPFPLSVIDYSAQGILEISITESLK